MTHLRLLIMTSKLNVSYRSCEEMIRSSNFYSGLKLLPSNKRKALSVVYAFMRHCDDISDNSGPILEKERQFDITKKWLEQDIQGERTVHSIIPSLQDIVKNYGIPIQYFFQVITGTKMDLTKSRYQTFEELTNYCYHVASTVGLICIHIFGFREPKAKQHAIACGIAFQLTNILRDISEDLERNRVYIPIEDLRRFNYTIEDLNNKIVDHRFKALMAFQVDRARKYFLEAQSLIKLIERSSRPAFWSMLESYNTLLKYIEEREYDVLNNRIKLSTKDKLRIVLHSLLHW